MGTLWLTFWLRLKDRYNELTEHQRDLWRLAAGTLVVSLLAAVGWWIVRPTWRQWQSKKAVEQAQRFAAHSDYRSAALALRRAIQLGPSDPTIWREAAGLLAEIGSPEALLAQQQVARLNPDDVAVRLALVGSAMKQDRLDLASATLEEVAAAAQGESAFYRLAASLALATGQAEEAEKNLARWVESDPTSDVAKFEYAAVRLWSVDEAKRGAAREALRGLAAAPKVGVRAALELLKDAARQRDEGRAIALMGSLLRQLEPGAVPVFTGPGAAGWTQLVEALKREAAKDPSDVARLARWLVDVGQDREALVWLDTLPDSLAGIPSVADAAAELAARTGDLDRLEARLQQGAWGVWPREALTLALASRVQRLRYSDANSRATWKDALAASGSSATGLRALVRLAAAWGDESAIESSLRAVLEREPKAFWAFGALRDLYAGRPDLSKLGQLYDQWRRQAAGDPAVALPWIEVNCLLDRVTPEMRSVAESLQAENPQSTAATIVLAAVRWRQRKPRDTIALLQALPAPVLDQSNAALWLGLAAADLGDRETATAALTKAGRANLPPESADLIRTAMARFGRL